MPQNQIVGHSPRIPRNSLDADNKIPPHPWIVRFSREVDPGKKYYFNTSTGQAQWIFPHDSIAGARRPCLPHERRDYVTGMCVPISRIPDIDP